MNAIGKSERKRAKIEWAELFKHSYMLVVIVLLLFPLYLTLIGSVKNLDQILSNFFLPTWPMKFSNYAKAFSKVSPYF